ncbi:MAG: TAXI family TRAP transporter solute-binding subunit [Solobacterium sp.]|nr:TAXI family TRAP transporter solute-binding subunit [Solobacterium sp.]
MKFRSILMSSLLICLTAGCGGSSAAMRFGTSEKGGGYHQLGTEIVDILLENGIIAEGEAVETAGSAANITMMSEGKLKLALAQADILYDAYNGERMFNNAFSVKGYQAIAGIYPETVHIIIGRNSDIRSLDDLRGKTISVGVSESGTEQDAFCILNAAGLQPTDVTTVNMKTSEAAEALKSGEIDVLFSTSGVPNPSVLELFESGTARFLPIGTEMISSICDQYEYFFPYRIDSSGYPNMETDYDGIAVRSVLICSESLPADTVQQITEALFENTERVEQCIPVRFVLQEETAVKDIPIPFHPGAVKYYETKGIQVR